MKSVPISAVIPVYNGEHFIGEAIKSVQAQTFAVDEIIVVDNNCTDNSRKIAEDLGAKLIRERKQSPSAARNKGIQTAQNQLIAFLDCDDLWDKQKIEYQWTALEKYPQSRIVSCDAVTLFDSTGEKTDITKPDPSPELDFNKTIIGEIYSFSSSFTADLFNWFWFTSSAVLIHKEVFKKIGLFDETLLYMEDMDLFCRVLACFPGATVNKGLVFYRRHNHNMTLNTEVSEDYDIRFINEYVIKSPGKYLPGMKEYIIERYKSIFVRKGRYLGEKVKN